MKEISESDLAVYAAWVSALQGKEYMSRFHPQEYIDRGIIKTDNMIWDAIMLTDGAFCKPIGSVWLERKEANDDFAVLGILIGDERRFGQGIGRNAIALVEVEAKRKFSGLKKIRLNVRSGNARAIACYKKAGFTITEAAVKTTAENRRIEIFRMEKST